MCISSKSLDGTKNTYIDYHIESMTPGIGAYCHVMAKAPYIPGDSYTMKWQYVGYIDPSIENIFRFLWGPNDGFPSLQCMSPPAGTYLRWWWTSGDSSKATPCSNCTVSDTNAMGEAIPYILPDSD